MGIRLLIVQGHTGRRQQHARIANIRRDNLHQLSTSITRRFHAIGSRKRCMR
jgi:hypothetical protein